MHDPADDGQSSAPRFSASDADGRLYAPTFERNGGPILNVLAGLLTGTPGAIVEVGCGSGQHSVALGVAHPDRTVVPTDIVAAHHTSAAAHAVAAGLSNVQSPRTLDAAADWAETVTDLAPVAMVLAVNVVHIAPWAVAEGLFKGAGQVLTPGAALALYGPFRVPGELMVPSNTAFDEHLRARDARWGIRALDDLDALAVAAGLGPHERTEMPANNLIAAWRRLG